MLFWLLFLFAFLATGCSSRQAAPNGWYEGTELDGASSGTWIERINHYRSIAGVGPIAEDPTLAVGDRAHAQYVVKNFESGSYSGGLVHSETPGNRWYTQDGDRAARRGDVAIRQIGGGSGAIDARAIDEWIVGPFHRLELLDPALSGAGWGSYAENGVSASVMEVRSAARAPRSPVRRMRVSRPPPARPVTFPPPGESIPFARYPGGEWPDPLASCGYSAPSGVPITIQFENGATPIIESYSVSQGATPVESCAYTAATYRASDRMQQLSGAHALRDHSALVIIPRDPLQYGSTYTVSIAVNRHQYRWSFNVQRPSGAPQQVQVTQQDLPPF